MSFLSNLRDHPSAKKYNLVFVTKTEDNRESYRKIWADLHAGVASPKIGMLLSDAKTGQIAEEFTKFIA